jgi:hypothetical protein
MLSNAIHILRQSRVPLKANIRSMIDTGSLIPSLCLGEVND